MLYKYKYYLILIFLSVLITGCGQQNKEIYRDSWKEDVLVAQDCGLSGLACCLDKEKKCETGMECCFDPSDQTKSYCGESCDTGKIDKFCRKDEPRCDGTAVCVNNYCTACGVTGSPCCEDNKCIDASKTDAQHSECLNNLCALCGERDEVVCSGAYRCKRGYLDNGGLCLKCGGTNQPCCTGENVCEKNMKCQLGFCS